MLKPRRMSYLPRTLILGDLHLVKETPEAVTLDLSRLIEAHPGARIIFAGDLFDLAASMPRRPREEAVAVALEAHPAARAALGRHVDQGGELWLVGGNHDAEVSSPDFRASLLDAIRVSPEARRRVRASPWFFREGGLHLEHGHLYDPDNAPAHPLVNGAASLGVHFVEEFVAPTGAHRYLQVNDDTPLRLFLSSFSWYGRRAPYVIYRYFYAALGAMLKSGPLYRGSDEILVGQREAARFAEEIGIPAASVDDLFALGATPTLASLSRTFSRLYFDRVIAVIAMTSGLSLAGLGGRRSGAAVFGLGALLMGTSWAQGHNRYAGTVAERLEKSAARIRDATRASLVIFGHTHREALAEGYANTGSFAFPRGAPGRPYLELSGSATAPRAERRYWRE
jgi:UDP-2,3-diacylglucosamine pyrophosphatase LpxH